MKHLPGVRTRAEVVVHLGGIRRLHIVRLLILALRLEVDLPLRALVDIEKTVATISTTRWRQ